VFRGGVAADLLTVRGTRILPGDWAVELGRDPLSAWLKAAATLLEHRLLAGFRRGWRKEYVEFLDAGVPMRWLLDQPLGERMCTGFRRKMPQFCAAARAAG
jgi:hypothetical protein